MAEKERSKKEYIKTSNVWADVFQRKKKSGTTLLSLWTEYKGLQGKKS